MAEHSPLSNSIPMHDSVLHDSGSDIASEDRGNNTPADGSGHSLNESGPSTPLQTTDSVTDNVTVKPYAIEEPDDDRPDDDWAPVAQKELPCLPDNFERWQRELADYMNDLDSATDSSHAWTHPSSPKRGKKRKPTGTGHLHPLNCHPFGSRSRSQDTHSTGLCPKRPRRRSKHPKEDGPISLHDFREAREAQSSASSSPDGRSTDTSSTETMNDTPMGDEMDID
ncbi:hypothetical protein N7510_000442 [Penicillium lagena]|uniref:uncharacterized protein n=1 Tax=Penicillium lagena TaxID=94218 RepID=UPI002541A634|nr:uncharacterized protein N7510_000442 [Penicillium lagena]KAJ5624133.1 hypothetical protein N7510_000442 [Penicillium lagena]